MKNLILCCGLTAGLLAGLATTGFAAPQAEPLTEDTWEGRPVLSLDEIELVHYSPRHKTAEALFRVAIPMVSRHFYVRERGEYGDPVSNITTIGDSIVIYDSAEYTKRILKTFEMLDVASQEVAEEECPKLTVLEYRPRYITLESALMALRSFQRSIPQWDDQNNGWNVQNLTVVEDRSLVIIRDREGTAQEMLSLLQRIDVPEQQVLLTCYMIRGKKQADSAGLPKELVDNLGKLVPQFQFESAGFAMVQTAAAPGREVQLRVEGSPTDIYEIALRPTAFDTKTSSLTIDRCQVLKHLFQEIVISQGPNGIEKEMRPAGVSELFSTSTLLRGGEYTVLGATGKEPIFLVLRLTPMQ